MKFPMAAASAIVFAVLAGCASSPEDLRAAKDTVTATRSFSENYQEIYRRVVNMGKQCRDGYAGAFASFELDHELYNELGRGEVASRMNNMGANNYYWQAIITRTGEASSEMTVYSGSTLRNEAALDQVFGWAMGQKTCATGDVIQDDEA